MSFQQPAFAQGGFQQQSFQQPQVQDPLGMRVIRGKDWKWRDQDGGGEGTCLKRARGNDGWVKVHWDNGQKNNYRWGAEGCFDLRIIGVALARHVVGRRVRRGRDWKWGDQDGNGGLGIVVSSPQDGVVEVRWYGSGATNHYRWGAEGAYDVVIVSDPKPTSAQSSTPQGQQGTKGAADVGSVQELDVLWACLVALHKSVDPAALGPINLQKPPNIAKFYNALYQYETAIREGAQSPEWKAGRRAFWEQEMKSDRCDAAHAATMLIAVEMNIMPAAQSPTWREERKPWMQLLNTLGAWELQFPAAGGLAGSKGGSLGRGLTPQQELEVLWTCLVALHKSIDPEALGKINLQKPENIAGFYQALFKYECAVKTGAQTPEWKSSRRAQWEAEMKSDKCDAAHAATMLIAVEMNIVGGAQQASWREERKPWLAALIQLGGREMQWTGPVAEASGGGEGGLAPLEKLNILWACLVALHKSVIPEALGPINLTKPANLEGFYNCLWKYECAIRTEVQTPEWKSFRRAFWEREMKSPRCDASHAATMLVALEMNVVPGAQQPAWKEERKPWLAVLARLGAVDLRYPSPSGGDSINFQ